MIRKTASYEAGMMPWASNKFFVLGFQIGCMLIAIPLAVLVRQILEEPIELFMSERINIITNGHHQFDQIRYEGERLVLANGRFVCTCVVDF